ncbi:MAG: putative lipid II flippase FtsW [Oscillospiraceae bacterium]|nr:putative lipid II flippase FtsW [Oscillospiraceae bacterium]
MAARKKAVSEETQRPGRGNIDVTFLVLVLLLLTFGLVMMFSASYAYAYYRMDDSFYYIKRQLLFAVGGLGVMIFLAYFDYRWWRKLALPVFAASILMLVVVLFMPERNGAKRWIELGPLTFQPSEIAKFAVILMFASMVALYGEKMRSFRYGILPFAAVLGVVAALMVLEPHLSGTILILSIGAVMMFVGGTDLKWFLLLLCVLVAAVGIVVLIPGVIEYAQSRFQYWLDPFSDAQGKGFQTIQSLLAIGSGGFMGLGLGNSRQKYLYIPEPQNDFVFSIVCEELGFVGAAIIVILFALLVWRGFVIAIRAKDKFGSMLAVGLTTQVGLQALLNIAVVTNTIPNTGISLPFFSYGGSALIMLLAQMGVVLSVSRQAALEKQ